MLYGEQVYLQSQLKNSFLSALLVRQERGNGFCFSFLEIQYEMVGFEVSVHLLQIDSEWKLWHGYCTNHHVKCPGWFAVNSSLENQTEISGEPSQTNITGGNAKIDKRPL